MSEPLAVRVQRAALRVLPDSVREEDGEEIIATFAAMWEEASRRRRKLRTLVRVVGGFVVLIGLEWWDRIGAGPPGVGGLRRESGMMDGMVRLVGQGLRSLRKSPSFTLSVVLLLGLGVGGVTTIFTLVDHVLLRPLPYPAADRLFEVQNGSHSGPTWQDFQTFRSVERWAGAMTNDANLTGTGRPLRIRQARITTDFFELFGGRPLLGRLPVAEDHRTAAGVVLSAGLWQRVYGGDRAVIGRAVTIDGVPDVIIGVLDAGFVVPEAVVGSTVDVWRPLDWTSEVLATREYHVLSVVGHYRSEASLAAVEEEAQALAEQRAAAFPDQYANADGTIDELPIVNLQDATVGGARQGLNLLLAAVGLLLLVACTNVAHLFMARGLSRMREMAVRRTLGARTRTITAQLVVESLMTGLAGALVGIVLANLGLHAFLGLSPSALPRSDALTLDLRILIFAIVIAAGTALLFGLLPALRLAGRDVAAVLGSRARGSTEGRGAHRARSALVVAEVALSLVLVTQAGSFLRSFARLHEQPLGFRTDGVWTVPMTPREIREPAEWVRRMQSIRGALAATPGVERATFGLTMPLEFTGGSRCCWSGTIEVPGIEDGQRTSFHPVDSDYFELLELQFVAGSGWARSDEGTQPGPVVISEPLAIAAFGSAGAALGRVLVVGRASWRITGVVADNRHYGPDRPHGGATYLPANSLTFAPGRVHMAVKVTGGSDGLAARLREAVWSVEPDLPVPTVQALSDLASASTARARFESVMFSTFGVVALLLVAGGLYGTLLYSVGQRRRELGIRLALGDAPAQVEGRIMSQGVSMAGIGCIAGVAGAWGFGRLLQNRLFEVQAGDPITLIIGTLILLLVALLASWLPARRAAGTDPMEALRAE